MNQPTALRPQMIAADVPVNTSLNSLSADQKYEILVNGTDPFENLQRTEKLEVPQLSDTINLGSSFNNNT
ncbi:10578_t:CDS:1, partial [Scutellospora calospora]